jgi:hypothetical protein
MDLNVDPQITGAIIQFIGTIIGSLLGAWVVSRNPPPFVRVVGAAIAVIFLMLAIVIGVSVLPKLINPPLIAQPTDTQPPVAQPTDKQPPPLPTDTQPPPSATTDTRPAWIETESRDYDAPTLDEYVQENYLLCLTTGPIIVQTTSGPLQFFDNGRGSAICWVGPQQAMAKNLNGSTSLKHLTVVSGDPEVIAITLV